MARMTGFIFQDEYLERLAKLSDQEIGRLVRALSLYHATGEAQELAGREGIAYDFIKADIDKIDQKYEAKCATNSMNRQRALTNVNEQQPTTTNDANIKEIEIKNNKEKESKEKKRFTPPTREEVAAYISEKGYKVDPDRWLAYYESNGWKVGRNPMKDWKAAVRTWATNNIDSKPQSKPKTVVGQQYTQRDYSNEPEVNDLVDWLNEEREKQEAET